MTILKKFAHIGVVVDNLVQAMEELSNFFGLDCQEVMEMTDSGIKLHFIRWEQGKWS